MKTWAKIKIASFLMRLTPFALKRASFMKINANNTCFRFLFSQGKVGSTTLKREIRRYFQPNKRCFAIKEGGFSVDYGGLYRFGYTFSSTHDLGKLIRSVFFDTTSPPPPPPPEQP